MIVPDSVKKEWVTPPGKIEILSEDLQTTRTQLEGDLQTIQTQLNTHTHPLEEHTHQDLADQLTTEKTKTYELQKKVELLEMSHASLIQRIEALENL